MQDHVQDARVKKFAAKNNSTYKALKELREKKNGQ
jgi:hypothetical protein